MDASVRPERSEAADYYFTYIEKVPDGDISEILEHQLADVVARLREITDERSRHRYAPEKWSIRDVVAHISDCERMFVFRALWFARGFDTSLPSFDQDIAADAAQARDRAWSGLVDEFEHVRHASVDFFRSLPEDAWDRRGIASGNPFTVRALAYITAGHLEHHMRILRERYLSGHSVVSG